MKKFFKFVWEVLIEMADARARQHIKNGGLY